MNVLSLFDGMSCARIALEKCNFKIENYFASEVDKYAIKVSSDNWPEIIQLGDVAKINYSKLPKIDLLCGGSPCQGFSFAGKQLNFNDPRSSLFFEFVKALKITKPRYFLLENVKMKKEFQDVISDLLGVQPMEINSSLVSAQNRKRLYWTNIPGVKQPEDKKIYLKDIIEDGLTDRDKSLCLDASYFKGGNLKQYFEKHRRQREPKILTFEKPHGFCKGGFSEKDKFSTLRKATKDNYAVCDKPIQVNPSKKSGNKQPYIQDRVFSVEGKSHALTSSFADRTNIELEDLKWRKLTVLECKRLQTVPDDYIMNVSNSQAYKMLGNGWTVDVIVHIFKNMENV